MAVLPIHAKPLEWQVPILVSENEETDDATGRHFRPTGTGGFEKSSGYQVAGHTDSTVYFTWMRRNGTGDLDIMFRKRGPAGWLTDEVSVTNDNDNLHVDDPSIAVDPNGVIHILYNTKPVSGLALEVVHRFSSDGGESWGFSPAFVSDSSDVDPQDGFKVDAQKPTLTIDAAGNLWATWSNKYKDNLDENPNHLGYYNVRLANESAWKTPQRSSYSTYEPLRLHDAQASPDCVEGEVKCVFLPARAAQWGHFVALGPGDLFLLFGDSPLLEGPTVHQYDSCSDLDSSSTAPRENYCWLGLTDIVLAKAGVWNAGAQALWWWNQNGFLQGSDVRCSPVVWEEGEPLPEPCSIADSCSVQGVPRSYTPYVGHRQAYNFPHGAVAHRSGPGTDAVVYAFWSETDGTTWGGPKGGDTWVRAFTRSGGSWDKGTKIECVSRTPYFTSGNPSGQDSNRFPCAAGADGDGWIHLVYERKAVEGSVPSNPPLLPPEEDLTSQEFWTAPDRQIYYTTHDAAGLNPLVDLALWGWEVQISDPPADSLATAFASVAHAGGGVHVIYTQYRSGTDLDVFYREGTAIQPSVASGDTVVWDGTLVFLDEDFTVQPGGTLIIEAGTKVLFQTPEDTEEDPLLRILVQGQLLVNGTPTEPVTFTSTKDSTAGEWDSITFELDGAYATGYGYVGCAEPLSSISNAHIENASYGIRIRDHCAPSLSGVTFAQITNERHIMLDSTDVMIPLVADSSEIVGMGSWSLAKTKVVASNGVRFGQDLIGGESKADLIVYGILGTSGSSAQGDSVYFRPETITTVSSSTAGADWGGIMLSSSAEENLIEYIDVGYAANPLFMYYPGEGTSVRHSRVHHFADIGIWVQGASSGGAAIESNYVYRGTDLHNELGETGVFLDQAHECTFSGNTVEMRKGTEALEMSGYGVALYFGSYYCLTAPPPGYRLLEVAGNTLVGPGYEDDEQIGTLFGIHSNWVCGTPNQDVRITGNLIYDWNTAGIYLTQNVDLDVSCNRIELNRRGVEHFRNTQPNGLNVRLKENRIQIAGLANSGVRAWDAQKIKLGPQALTTGDNELRTNNQKRFIWENQAGFHLDLNAEQNHWFIGGVEQTLPKDVNKKPFIDTEFDTINAPANTPRVDVNPLLVYPPQPPTPCWPPGTPPSGAFAGLSDGSGPDERGSVHQEERESLPTRTEVGATFPNPARAGLSIPLAVSADHAGDFEIAVYDVRGRRTAAILERSIAAGRHLLEWDGRDSEGSRAAAGIYFLRVKGPAFAHISKLVLLK